MGQASKSRQAEGSPLQSLEGVQTRLREEFGAELAAGQDPATKPHVDLAAFTVALSGLGEEQLQWLLGQLPAHQLACALARILGPSVTAARQQQTQSVLQAAAPLQQQAQPASQAAARTQQQAQSVPQAAAPQQPVQSEPQSADQRQAERTGTLRGGKIVYNNKMCVSDCQVRDISDTGCRVTVESSAGIPDHFMLHILNGDVKRECEVAWRRSDMLGLRFID